MNNMLLNKIKCKALHLGQYSPKHKYKLGSEEELEVFEMKNRIVFWRTCGCLIPGSVRGQVGCSFLAA